ncbi:protein dopey-1 homolog [Diaphorina citri]|uniref:Protein dopey-1 homolog n=1 Tax=Diaphorina citri TaxID=121845 RepID=A0A3Q0JHY1_DIACI|nr:protein dopey-1 homolog [Diaphorina citri]
MLKMLDNLQLSENCPLKVEAQVWLLHSIMRGDIHRLLDPLLMMLLDPATARLSVLHARISTHQDSANSAKEEDQDEASTKIYAISSVDGNVMYHVSEKYNKSLKDISSKTNNVGKSGKKIVAVTSLSSGDNQCVTEKKRVNQNIYHDGRILFMILTDIFFVTG